MAAPCLLSACARQGVLDPQGPVASQERLILIDATAIMLVVVLPVIVLTLAFAYWYRASNKRAVYKPDWEYSGQVELVVWAIPAMVVILLAGVGWISSHQLDPYRKLESSAKPIQVQVASLDWKWLFIYPDQKVAAVNQLFIPVGTPVEFTLTSATVMNAFFVPQLGSQVYTMPGMAMRLSLMADRPGNYPGFSSHYSGNGFSDMRFVVHAVPAADFEAWLAKVRGEGSGLDAKTYTALTHPSSNVKPQTYRSVDPKLFEQIVQQTVPTAVASHTGP